MHIKSLLYSPSLWECADVPADILKHDIVWAEVIIEAWILDYPGEGVGRGSCVRQEGKE